MGWVYLDDGFPDHPKVARAGGDAAWLFVCGLAYARRYATEGRIPKGQVAKLTDRRNPTKLAGRLVQVGLWVDEGDLYRVHDYSEWNRPGEVRKAAARKAAQARWRKGGRNASGNANASTDALPADYANGASDDADPDASGCPLPNSGFTSSSGLEPVEPAPDDDDHDPPDTAGQADPTADQHERDPITEVALAILAQRDLDRRQENPQLPTIGDIGSWLLKATDQRRHRHEAELAQLRSADPDASPEQLADALDPPPSDAHTGPPVEGQLEAQMAAAEAGMANTKALLAEPPDVDRNLAGVADVKALLRQPGATP